jgi:predicted nucleic acid-binding protein
MNIVDSSCWLEYLTGSEIGEKVAKAVEDIKSLIVPSIILYEVFKKLLIEKDEDVAFFVIAQMKQGKVIDLDGDLSIFAARLGKEYSLALADSIIYATALKYDSILWTQDKHFKDLKGVKYFRKKSNGG